ncbi:hypothetical protein ETU08_01100 [Apibacter muscae]|uniref:hypothetical protein n=1 Tax=Apibacter muscae TaxID=2509004 RepID=UPI0011AC95F2|nr:hypothetical protein [Apibacter muscae]TWP31416.1 hypothetical protein ETU08_01100 [Apibacter muscae]
MKKIYTLPIILLSITSYAQLEEVQEETSSQQGYILKQEGSVIDVEKKEAIMTQQQILLAENSGKKAENPANPTIFRTTDANGNELWVLSNGVVVRNVTQESNYSKEPMSVLRSKEGVKVKNVPISKPSEVYEENITTTTKNIELEEVVIPKLESQQENIVTQDNISNKQESYVTEEAAVPNKQEKKESFTDNKDIKLEKSTNSDISSQTNITKPVDQTNASELKSTINLSETTAVSQPGDIIITAEDLKDQDISELFSPDVNSMSPKDRKQYEKNQKKIKKQLEKDLKKESSYK